MGRMAKSMRKLAMTVAAALVGCADDTAASARVDTSTGADITTAESGTSTAVPADTSTSTTAADASSSDGGTAPDVGDHHEPIPRARIVADAEDGDDHALDLYEIIDGVAQPPRRIAQGQHALQQLRFLPLGELDHVVYVAYTDPIYRGMYLVDWSGEPTTEFLGSSLLTTSVEWVANENALFVFGDGVPKRVDLVEGGISTTTELFTDLPAEAYVEEQGPHVLQPHDIVVLLAGNTTRDIYVGSFADPREPSTRLSELEGTGMRASNPIALPSRHLVYAIDSIDYSEPSRVQMVAWDGDSYGPPIEIGVDPTLSATSVYPVPTRDAFMFWTIPSSAFAGSMFYVEVVDGMPSEPIDLGLMHNARAFPDGQRLLLSRDGISLDVVEVDESGLGGPQRIFELPPAFSGVQSLLAKDLSSPTHLVAQLMSESVTGSVALARVPYDGRGEPSYIPGPPDMQTVVHRWAANSDGTRIATVSSGADGYHAQMQHCDADGCGPNIDVADDDAPRLYDVAFSLDDRWLSVRGGGAPSNTLTIVATDAPQEPVLSVTELAGDVVWLP
jgi:hypothetical protein